MRDRNTPTKEPSSSVPIAKDNYARNDRVSIDLQGSPRMSQVRLMLKAGLETNERARLRFPCQLFDGRSYLIAQLN